MSVDAAQAVHEKFLAALANRALPDRSDAPDPAAAGLSRAEARYLRGIAEARVDWAALRNLPDDQAIANLTALPGIGRWTAEIYLKFALGRPDVFAAGDLALAESARLLYGLPERPGPAALIALAEPWRPWRAVAARALWAYYHVAKGREGVR